MSAIDGFLHRLRVLIRGEAYVDEIRREMEFHRELDDLAQNGNSLGNETYYREEVRGVSMLAWIDRLRRNVAYALRGIRRSPGYSAMVVVTIGVGVGANAAMFSVLDRLLLRPPPGVANPASLRRLYLDVGYAVSHKGSTIAPHFNYPAYDAIRNAWDAAGERRARVIAYTNPDSFALAESSAPIRVSFVSADYFAVLGVIPVGGRLFGVDEASIATPTPVAVISERLWRGTLGGDRSVIGRKIRFGRVQMTIVGIAPGEFTGLAQSATDVWVPLNNFAGSSLSPRTTPWYREGGYYLSLAARLPVDANETELTTRARGPLRDVARELHSHDSSTVLLGSIIDARGLSEQSSELELTTRVAAVAMIVLLIACANVANLMLTRAARRARELAVRRALGASRARLHEQLLTESLVLALVGGAVAIAVGVWGAEALHRLLFPGTYWVGGALNWRVLTFALGTVTAVGVIAGFAPALFAGRADVVASLRSGSVERGLRRSRLSTSLLVLQTAMSVILLFGAGLLVRSRQNVSAIDLGVDADRLVFANLGTSREKQYGLEVVPVFREIASGMRGFPGFVSAAMTSVAPLTGIGFSQLYLPDGDSVSRIARQYPNFNIVSPEFFATAGVRLAAGRLFDDRDDAAAAPVVIVSRKFASLVWPDRQPLGQCVKVGEMNAPCSTVVGVVENSHGMGVIEAPALAWYRPIAQAKWGSITMIVRADPKRTSAVASELRHRLEQRFPDAPAISARPIKLLVDRQTRSWRVGADLFTAFGMLAVIVAAVGIYSMIAYGVAQRTHEMGVRIALGADARTIVDLIVREGMLAVALGLVVGIVVARTLSRYVASLLFGVTANDLSTTIGSVAVLAGVALAACLIPAWRGARVDPMVALRTD